jgi:RNA polymerase sigma factor (sigma-70 family)
MAEDRESDDALLAATATDPQAFGRFYRRHAKAVLTYLLHRTRDPDRALDLTAEVFAAALLASHRYKPGPTPARGWLFGIANHKLADSRRRRASDDRARRKLGMQRLRFEDDELERVEELIDLELREGRVEALVADLPPGQRAAVLARVVDEREYPEIAAELGVSEQAARQRVSRGLARLALWARRTGDE